MNEYQKALITLKGNSTPKAKEGTLIRLAVLTEDMIFKSLLEQVIDAYHYYLAPGHICRNAPSRIPANHAEAVECLRQPKKDLEDYIEMMLQTKTLQWQILAKRHGWKPSTS